jgi:hypothetical protein
MERSFEPILSRETPLGEERFTATAELVARETGVERPTVADIRRWLETNADAATRAAFLWRLNHPAHPVRDDGTSTWDGVVRLGPDDYPPD